MFDLNCDNVAAALDKRLKLALTAALSIVLVSCGGATTRSNSESTVIASQSTPSEAAAPVAVVPSVPTSTGQCNDGIDNDGDGLTDWQHDVGCSGPDDTTEVALDRDQEDGWTTFDLSSDSRVIYVSSSEGRDSNDGLSPGSAIATLARGLELLRDDTPDFLLLKRGDTWRDEHLGRLKSGRSASERLVVSSYGDSFERPRLEISNYFVNDDGRPRSHIAIMGLELVVYAKDVLDSEFTGTGKAALRFVGTHSGNNTRGNNLLFEDNYILYGDIVLQSSDNAQVRRNIVYKHYESGTCAYDSSGSRIARGSIESRPSGMYAAYVDGLLLEDNLWDANGWNPDIPEGVNGACATIYNHNVYVTDVKNTTVKNDIFLRSSSIGLKVSGNSSRGVENMTVENNLFAEGEIGLSMAGNGTMEYTHVGANISNNVFTDIGRANPTTRGISWGVWLKNGDAGLYENNLFVNPPQASSSSAFLVEGGTQRDIVIRNNLAYDYSDSMIKVNADSGWQSLLVAENLLVTNSSEEPIVRHIGSFSDTTYRDNSYYSSGDVTRWFSADHASSALDQWAVVSGETGSSIASYSPPNEGRNVDSYAQSLGIGSTIEDFAREARKQSRFNYRSELSAEAVNDYIRAGYDPGL